ncbi:hypothetical protein DESUT3_34060 [Desulfuromonas versatilis]|uniref:diguanylate cyclase n=1 Tax=Desulfuromonas versatilis TaxID=2802975 RepID=A0ABM8I081_9BACT|nr:diguanylate cyclase [Desulfuromonas versatilis]BCR06337.1 hypothetical protein DESUT3_34060 [Desulfuromonas versatilis]
MVEHIQGLLAQGKADDRQLVESLERLARKLGDETYREVLRALAGKEFPVEQAKKYWQAALQHQGEFFSALPLEQGLRPALLHYLQNIAGEFRDPRIIEAEQLKGLEKASLTDGLTGLFNQTYLKAHLDRLLASQRPSDQYQFAVILFDLDRFKQYNDRCGHLCGDQALRQTAETIQEQVRQGDIASRYGGEEFAVVLHRLNEAQAFAVAERIRAGVEDLPFNRQELLDTGNLTISGGIALYPKDGLTTEALLDFADQQLYQAKHARNQICPQRSEFRRAARLRMQSMVEFALPNHEVFYTGLTFDISPGGMAIGCDAEIQPGTNLQLRFKKPFWPVDRNLSATVRNIRRDNRDGIVRIGLQFDEPWDAIQPLLPEAVAAREASQATVARIAGLSR